MSSVQDEETNFLNLDKENDTLLNHYSVICWYHFGLVLSRLNLGIV